MRTKFLLFDQQHYDVMIDTFIRNEFRFLERMVDREFFDYFVNYFRIEIFENTSFTERFFLRDEEKTLQYLDPNSIESAIEYDFLITKQISNRLKTHYAKKGGNFCVVLPVLNYSRNRNEYQSKAAEFYHLASVYTEDDFNVHFFGFLEGATEEMTSGLEHTLERLKEDGMKTIEKALEEASSLYKVAENENDSEELAKRIVKYARMLEMEDIPIKKEHYRFLLE